MSGYEKKSLILMIPIVTMHIANMLTIIKNHHLHNISYYILVNLSISDVLMLVRFLRSKKYRRIDTSKILSSRTSVCVACTVSTEDSLLFVKKKYCPSYRATRFLPKKRRESTRFNPR